MAASRRPRRPRTNNLVGITRGLLTVIAATNERVGITTVWLCQCACGNTAKLSTIQLMEHRCKGHCGCLKVPRASRPGREYWIWSSMHNRCNNPSEPNYPRYGGRGIKVCERWQVFENFLADMGERPPSTSIERADNNGDYEPANCRWATHREQNRNTSGNHRVTFNGRTMCITEWADETGIRAKVIGARINGGWSVGRALTTPLMQNKSHRR